MKKRTPKKLFSYSDYEAQEQELEYRRENWQDFFESKPTEQELENNLNDDDSFYRFAWEDFQDSLDELMDELQEKNLNKNRTTDGNFYWLDTAKGMGWRNLSGHKSFKADEPTDLLEAITPDTCDYSISIHKGGKTFFYARISHHDAPMGEWHRIQAITEARYNKLNN